MKYKVLEYRGKNPYSQEVEIRRAVYNLRMINFIEIDYLKLETKAWIQFLKRGDADLIFEHKVSKIIKTKDDKPYTIMFSKN